MKIEFTPAVRRKTKARIALCGPSGSGKTYTALTFAHVLAPGSIALIDTEKESADGYEGLNGWHWASFKPATYEPDMLIDALAAAAAAGMGCAVIDSLSHFWMGTGGMLEQVDNSTKRSRSSSSFSSGWKEMRPVERRMIDALTGYPGHLIVTMRTKSEWVVQDNAQGKAAPRKVGTKPEQREGIEYEFSVVADMDVDNVLTIGKTRVPTLKRGVFAEPGPEVAQKILDWLNDGGDALPDLNDYRDRALGKHATREDLLALLAEVEEKHVDRATMQDETGETVTLRDLIIRRGKEAAGISTPAPEPPARQQDERPQAQQPVAAAPQQSPASSAVAPSGEAAEDDEWVQEFYARLAESGPADIRARRAEVLTAKSARKISPATANDLLADIDKRKAEVSAERAA